ncbi:MAG: pyruvate formate-lyase-activating protein [Oscillospiraceae bacterium]|nr:pyruvate formate-lyase-activating protein [Oscillospiraceae bacterium]
MDINLNQTGKIHSIETCGTVDGPGIRYVVFAQGCNLRCVYCHNPDTWSLSGKNATEKSVGELLSDILRYKSYFTFSGGGITLTGGDPLMQKEFALELFRACKEENIHITLDTAGHTDLDDITKEILSLTDLVLLDIKSINPATYQKVTRFPIDKLLNFTQYLSENMVRTWHRFVLVPGLTDDENEILDLIEYIKTLKNKEKIGILPFHQMGAYKWDDLKMKYKLRDTPVPTAEETEQVRELFRSHGFVVT